MSLYRTPSYMSSGIEVPGREAEAALLTMAGFPLVLPNACSGCSMQPVCRFPENCNRGKILIFFTRSIAATIFAAGLPPRRRAG